MNKLLGQLAEVIRSWGFFRIVRVIEFAAVIIAIFAFFNDLNYRHEERIARAWQLLTTPAPGNSGKGGALEYLNSRGVALMGIDLTPPILAEQWKQIPIGERELEGECPQYTHLRNVRLSEAVLVDAVLVCTHLIESNLQGANLLRAKLQGAVFLMTELQGAFFVNAELQGADLAGANLAGVDLQGADLQGANLILAKLQGADLQGADLRQIQGLSCSELKQAKHWEAAARDERLRCDKPIPPPSKAILGFAF